MNSRQRYTRISLLFASLGAIASLGSCGGSSSTDPGGTPATIELSDDDIAFSSLLASQDLDATVRDADGRVLSTHVAWTTDAASVALVNAQGVVTAAGNGTTRVIATAGTVSDTADVTVQQVAATLALTPDTLRLTSEGETATIGTTVRDAGGSAMSGVPVTFATENESVATVDVSTGLVTAEGTGATRIFAQVAPGGPGLTRNIRVEVGGSLAPAYLVGGYVGAPYEDQIPAASGGGATFAYDVTAGSLPTGLVLDPVTRTIEGTPTVPGVHFFEVTASNGELTVSERYAITISSKPETAFNLWVAYNGGPLPHANARAALTNAVVRWEEIVTGDAGASVTYSANAFPSSGCNALVDGTLYNSAFIDDVAILVSIAAIDGPSNTLAQAGPCGGSRPQLPVVVSGQMRIDQADASSSATFLKDVIVHEIGHVLGIGTFWQDSTVFFGTDSVAYFGHNGKTQWNLLGEAGNVPIQPEVSAHWDESWFDAEIMTPIAESPGTPNPVSKVSIGVLMDFGWTVSLDAADAYSLPGCRPTCGAPPRAPGGGIPLDDVVIEPLFPLPPTAFGPGRN